MADRRADDRLDVVGVDEPEVGVGRAGEPFLAERGADRVQRGVGDGVGDQVGRLERLPAAVVGVVLRAEVERGVDAHVAVDGAVVGAHQLAELDRLRAGPLGERVVAGDRVGEAVQDARAGVVGRRDLGVLGGARGDRGRVGGGDADGAGGRDRAGARANDTDAWAPLEIMFEATIIAAAMPPAPMIAPGADVALLVWAAVIVAASSALTVEAAADGRAGCR